MSKVFNGSGGLGNRTKGLGKSTGVFDTGRGRPQTIVQQRAILSGALVQDTLDIQLSLDHALLSIGIRQVADLEELLVESRTKSTKRGFEVFITCASCTHDNVEHVEGKVVVVQASLMKSLEVLVEVTAEGNHIMFWVRVNGTTFDAVAYVVEASDRDRADNVHEAEPIDTEVIIGVAHVVELFLQGIVQGVEEKVLGILTVGVTVGVKVLGGNILGSRDPRSQVKKGMGVHNVDNLGRVDGALHVQNGIHTSVSHTSVELTLEGKEVLSLDEFVGKAGDTEVAGFGLGKDPVGTVLVRSNGDGHGFKSSPSTVGFTTSPDGPFVGLKLFETAKFGCGWLERQGGFARGRGGGARESASG